MSEQRNVIEYANDVIDREQADGPVNRITNELTVIDENLAVIESFSHVWVVRTSEGLVLFDASGAQTADRVVAALRTWTSDPVHTIVYTHGHMDHVGGAPAFLADAASRGHRSPQFVGHENVASRLARYRMTNDYNVAINQRQFAPGARSRASASAPARSLRPWIFRTPTGLTAIRWSCGGAPLSGGVGRCVTQDAGALAGSHRPSARPADRRTGAG